jgi:hypothetical protein
MSLNIVEITKNTEVIVSIFLAINKFKGLRKLALTNAKH